MTLVTGLEWDKRYLEFDSSRHVEYRNIVLEQTCSLLEPLIALSQNIEHRKERG